MITTGTSESSRHRVRRPLRAAAWLLAGCILVMPIACGGGDEEGTGTAGTKPDQGKAAKPAPVASMTTAEMHAAIRKDRTAAKETYQAELVEFEGVVDDLYFRSVAEKQVLCIGQLKDDQVSDAVECFIEPADEKQFEPLWHGQRVKVRGTCMIDLILVYLNDTKLVEAGPAPASVAVSAKQLVDEAQADEGAFDAKYKGKVLTVDGIVAEVESEANTMASEQHMVLKPQLDSPFGVRVGYSDHHANTIGKLAKGDKARIRAQCMGKGGSKNIEVRYGRLVK